MKKCCRCLKIKNFSCFSKRSRNKDGFEYFCRECSKKENDLKRDGLREADKKSYYKNQAKRIAKSSKYQYANRGNPLPQKYADLLIKVSKDPKTWKDVLERLRKLKQDNKEKYKKEYKAWSSTERGKLLNNLKSQRYRARKNNTTNNLTKEGIEFLFLFQDGKCACCDVEFSGTIKYEIDHVVPVSKKGDTTIENIQLLCRSCNARKRDKTIRYIPEITDFAMQSLRS